LEPEDHPDLETSPLLGARDTVLCSLINGAMHWAMALGRMDSFATTTTIY